MTDALPDGYDEWTVSDVRDEVSDATVNELAAMHEYEQDTKDRSTALEAIEEELESRTDGGDDEPADERREITGHAGYDAVKASDDDPIRLKNVSGDGLARCGHTWGEGEEKLVKRQPKLFLAIRRGELAYIDE